MNTNNHYQPIAKITLTLAFLLLFFSLERMPETTAQGESQFIRHVRNFDADTTGTIKPVGIAFAPQANNFLVMEAQPTPTNSEIIRITPYEDFEGTVAIGAAVVDPINMAFDSKRGRLLIIDSVANEMIEIKAGVDGTLDPSTLTRHDIQNVGLEDPQGMAIDPQSGHLFIVDSAGPRIVRVNPGFGQGFDNAQISEVDLKSTGLVDLRGLGFDPMSEHLHVYSRSDRELAELTQDGQVLSRRDLAEFEIGSLQGLVFAPSGDLTDDPAQQHLYIADSGSENPPSLAATSSDYTPRIAGDYQLFIPITVQGSSAGGGNGGGPGTIIELSLIEPLRAPAALAANDFTSSLIRLIDGSQWNPPSPDTAGVVYLPTKDRLLVADSEVNEMPLYQNVNLFETSLAGIILDTGTTLTPSNSNEPTGLAYNANNGDLFISDDNKKEIYIFKAGADGIYGTGDDSVTTFDTLDFGSSDPEGVTFDSSGQGTLYIADGLDNEVFIVTPGANGIFEGLAGDDNITSFDTLGIVRDPEGIALNTDTSTLYLVGNPPSNIAEVTTAGVLVRNIDISASGATSSDDNPAGLAYAPSSNIPNVYNIYIADRGVDNNSDSSENDGKIYEMTLPPLPLQPPVAGDDNAVTVRNIAVTIDVAANDSDADGNLDPSTANSSCTYNSSGCAGVTNGSLADNGNGTITYTPAQDFTGDTSFVYEICDSGLLCDTATVSITVTPPNDPPLAVDDSPNTPEDTAVIINVAGNDSDPDGNLDANSANSSCANGSPGCLEASNGSLTDNGNGTITYDPDQDFNGSDSFVYEICDTYTVCATAVVNIIVDPVNDPPVAMDDSAATVIDTPVTFNVSGNDQDIDGNLNPDSVNTDCVGCSTPGSGTLINNGGGSFTYTPNTGFAANDNFIYEICDTAGSCATAEVTVVVGAGTLDVRVEASTDDAEQRSSGSVTIGSSDLELTLDSSIQTVGMRFNGIDISPGSVIINATIQFQADETNAEATSLTIKGEDSDNAVTFASTSGNISTRPLTAASVAWEPAPWTTTGAAGPDQQTPNFARVVQEIVNRGGWSSGNSLAIIISGSGKRVAESFDGVAAAAPLLHIEYTSTGDRLPDVTIDAPANGSTFIVGNSIGFSGTASDFEDGDVTASLVWVSDVDGPIGSGASFSRSDLSAGVHAITATASDSGGQTAFDSKTITVFEDVPVLVGAGDIADFRVNDELTAQLLETIPGTVFTTGDNVYPDGTLAEYMTYYEPTWGRHKARTWPTSGNHEYNTPGATGYYDYFGAAAGDPDKGYYSFDVGDWHIVSLNSECAELGADGCGINSPQGQWLQADLAANPSVCTLAIWHRPLFSSGGGTTTVQDLWSILNAAGADVILTGHVHAYERFAPQDATGTLDLAHGIRQFVVGTGGGGLSTLPPTPAPNTEIRNDTSYGILKMTLNPTSYDWEFIPIPGDTFTDSGSAACVTDNLPPVTVDDGALTDEDTAVAINVTANDSDPDGILDPASANTSCTGCAEPASGALLNLGNGSFDYTPNLDFNGPDSFVYEVCDTLSACSTATVNITVNPAADPPVANDDSPSTPKNISATIDVLANDSDPDSDLDPATVNNACVGCTSPTNGNLIKNLDNTFAYTPNAGYIGSDSFVYEVCDTTAACDTATVNITVTPTNDPPLANDDSATTDEDTAVSINVAGNDSDQDGNLVPATANTACTTCDNPANGALVNNGDGSFTYTPNPDFNDVDSFVYEICDVLDLCDTATVIITVTAVADLPVAADDSANTVESTSVVIDVAVNDSDPDNDLDLTTTNTICAGCADPSSGTLVNSGSGSFSYTPNPGFTGNDSFIYEICDSTGLCDTATVAITVISAAPEIFEVRVAAGEDDGEEKVSGRVSLTSSDLELIFDNEDQKVGIRFNGVNVPQGASITNAYIQFQADEVHSDPITLTIEGDDSDNAAPITTVRFNISDTAVRPRTEELVDWAPAPWTTRGEAGPDQRTPDIAAVVQEIVDRPGWVNGNSLAVIITGTGTATAKRVAEAYNGDQAGAPLLHVEYSAVPNDPPLANDDSASTNEDTLVTIDVAANDSDINGNLDLASTITTCATCSAPANGTLVNNGNGSFNYTPDLNFYGGDSFVYEICDTRSACDTAAVTITVDAVNDPPVAEDETIVTSKNTAVSIDADANDSDVDGNLDPTTTNTACAGCAEPSNGTIVNNGDGSFSYSPGLDFIGSDSFAYEICDTGPLCDTATVNITITLTNDPPLANDDSASTDEDIPVTINVAGNDSDPDGNLDPTTANTSCSGCSEPANGSLANNGDGSFTYTPTANFNGADSFVYEICDSFGFCDTATVSISVTPVDDLPAAGDDSATVNQDSETNNIVVLDNDDFGGDGPSTGTITLLGQPGNGTAAVNDGTTPNDPTDDSIDYTPDTGYNGPDSFSYQICDADVDCDPATVSVTVSPASTLFISTSSSANVGGFAFNDEDIVTYDLGTGTWSMYFDGSDVGLSAASQEIDALHVDAGGSILLSLGAAGTLPGVGAVDEFDIVRFIPSSLGDTTAGTYELYFDGEDVGLSGEDIDAIGFAADGRLVFSLRGSYLPPVGPKGGDEDLLIFTATSFGETTAGSWELYLDGSLVGLNDNSGEDINGTWIDGNGDIYLTVRNTFAVAGVTGGGADIFTCVPGSLGDMTSCTFVPYWDGTVYGLAGEIINGFFLGP